MTAGLRDCACPRSVHHHGTTLAYNQDGCRCTPCSDAHRRHRKHWARRADLNRQAGLPVGLTDAAGTRRRMQALSVMGWSTTRLGAELGVSQQRAYELLLTSRQVRLTLALRVEALYDRIWDQRPTWAGADRTRANATRRGWFPPMAWDDDEIDNPNAVPLIKPVRDNLRGCVDEIAVAEAVHGRPVPLTRPELSKAIATLTGMGYSAKQISERLGTNDRRVTRARARTNRKKAA